MSINLIRMQRRNNDCGPICVYNYLTLLGYNIKYSTIYRICKTDKDGTDYEDLSRALKKYGFQSCYKIIKNRDVAYGFLSKWLYKGFGAIIPTYSGQHWTLILKIGKKYAQILDPEDGFPIRMELNKLYNIWKIKEKDKITYEVCIFHPIKKRSVDAVVLKDLIIKTAERL